MKLSTIFDNLRYGPLKGQAIAREGAEIEPINYPRLITCINTGLLALYGKFKLKYNEVAIRIIADKTSYEIHSDYADSNLTSSKPTRWIIDSSDLPFTDDYVLPHTVTLDDGTTLTINDTNDCTTVITPTYNSIKLPLEVIENNNICTLMYEASPELIEISSDIAPQEIDIKLPDIMLEALVYYSAAKFMEQSSSQDKISKAFEFFNNYEKKCNELDSQGMVSRDNISNPNIGLNDWP